MDASKFIKADFLQVVIARYCEAKYGPVAVMVGNEPAYDLKFSDGTLVEVKYDSTATRTNNVAIEFWNARDNKPSGILGTQSNLWMHCIPEGDGIRVYVLETKRLEKLCFEKGRIVCGGDFNSSVIKLIDVGEMKAVAKSSFYLPADKIGNIEFVTNSESSH